MADPSLSSYDRVVLVLGGARAGKSRYAEALVTSRRTPWIYLATARPGDEEMAARIRQHEALRGEGWRTYEAPIEVADMIVRHGEAHQTLLVDSLTLWLSNLIRDGRNIEEETTRLSHALSEKAATIVLVSNEAGLGMIPPDAGARRFRDELGRLNQRIAADADRIVFMAPGLPLTLKPAG